MLYFSSDIYPNPESISDYHRRKLKCRNRNFEKISFETVKENEFLDIFIWKTAYDRKFLLENAIYFNEDYLYGEDLLFLFNANIKSKKLNV